MRVGIGYDIHPLVVGRPLVIGGVTIPHERGLKGHSDADVLLHAICDAILGAAGLGDIGIHFPDNDQSYKDVSSVLLLSKTWKMVNKKFKSIVNIDATIFAETPKLSPYADLMRQKIAQTVDILPEQINIKSTTAEGLGFIGRKEGIAAMSIVLIN